MESTDSAVQFDLSDMTVGDIGRVDNPLLKSVLLKVKEHLEREPSPGDPLRHTEHSVHYSTYSSY